MSTQPLNPVRLVPLPTDEPVDRIEIVVEPQHRESHLTGSGWESRAVVRLYRKGALLDAARYRNVPAALIHVAAKVSNLNEGTWLPVPDACMQPGCDSPRAVLLKLRAQEGAGRAFCTTHMTRGDLHDADADADYLPSAVPEAGTPPSLESALATDRVVAEDD